MANAIVKEIEGFDLIVSEKIEFNAENRQEYLDIFEEKKKQGVFKGEFQEQEWIWVFGGVEYVITFPDELTFNKLANLFGRNKNEFIVAYKAFITIKSNHSCLKSFNSRMKAIGVDKNSSINRRIAPLLSDFIEFVKVPYKNKDLFQKAIEEAEKQAKKLKAGRKARTLPSFIDIFKFSDIINDIVENKDLANYKRYLMTIAWWKICSIIPLRPTEFTKTIFDCVDERNGQYIMQIKRSGAKGRDSDNVAYSHEEDDIYYDDEIVIDESMYKFIRRLQELFKSEFGYENEEKLLAKCLVTETAKNSLGEAKRKINKDQVVYEDLKKNLRYFYQDVVEKEYGFTPIEKRIKKDEDRRYIHKATLHDARHIAIINLVLLGADILEVKYLAGHEKINTTYGYYNHVKEISDSYAIAYKHRKKTEGAIINNDIIVIDRLRESNIQEFEKAMSGGQCSITNLPKIRGGYCSYSRIYEDKSICYKLERKHHKCPYFIANNVEVFNERIKELDEKIETEVSLLKDMLRDMDKIAKFHELYQAASGRLERSICEKIMLTTKI